MYSLTTLEKLLDRNIDASILCLEGSKMHQQALDNNFPVITTKKLGYFHISAKLKLGKMIKSQDFDLIHAMASKDLWALVPALKMTGNNLPLLMTKHMGSYIVKKDVLHKWIYSRLDTAFAISNVIAQNLVDTTPLKPEKIKILHNGINLNRFNPENVNGMYVREELGLDKNTILIGMLARFSPGKGHEEFLYAAKELIGRKKKLRFMIVGEPSVGENEYAQTIYNLAKKYKINDNIIFTGFRSDIPEIFDAIDIFVFPSHAEALGLALIEAIAMAKPTVCSSSDGVLDIAVDDVTSYLFRKQDAEDLTAKLEQLIESPVKQKEFAVNARKRAEENFDIELKTDELIEHYKEALSTKGKQSLDGIS